MLVISLLLSLVSGKYIEVSPDVGRSALSTAATTTTIEHAECDRLNDCDSVPEMMSYQHDENGNANSMSEACLAPVVSDLWTNFTSNRVEFRLMDASDNLYYAQCVEWADLDSTVIVPRDILEGYGYNLHPGIYDWSADVYFCVVDSQANQPAPLRCLTSFCIEVTDSYRPTSLEACPANFVGDATVQYEYDGIMYATFDEGTFDIPGYITQLSNFELWHTNVSNFPCVYGELGTRCDEVVNKTKAYGLDPVPGDGQNLDTFFDGITSEEESTLKNQIANADLVNEASPFDKSACTKCVYVKRYLKEWVNQATCDNPTESLKCVGDAEQVCSIAYCTSATATVLFDSSIGISKQYVDLSKKTISALRLDASVDSNTDHVYLYTTAGNRYVFMKYFFEVNSTTSDFLRYRYRIGDGRWRLVEENDRINFAVDKHIKKHTYTITIEGWSACGLVITEEFNLTVYYVYVRRPKYRKYYGRSYGRYYLEDDDLEIEMISLNPHETEQQPSLLEELYSLGYPYYLGFIAAFCSSALVLKLVYRRYQPQKSHDFYHEPPLY